MNITLLNNNNNFSTSDATTTQKQANNYLHKYRSYIEYRSYIDTLHADKSVEGSLANLQYKEQIEESEYEKL